MMERDISNASFAETGQESPYNYDRNKQIYETPTVSHTFISPSSSQDALQPQPSTETILSRSSSLQSSGLDLSKSEHSRTPFLRRPTDEVGGHWLEERHEAPEWWNLFYDLAVVAVLTIFSTNHELNQPSAIPVFLSYYAIICWVWTSQVHYDIRYQALDGWHRAAKAIQIMTFVYMGAASGDWNPGLIRNDEDHLATKSNIRASEHRTANESFKTVLASFVISRVFLACQYLIAAIIGSRAGRKVTPHIYTFISLVISSIFTILAIVLPAHSRVLSLTKVTLFYTGIGVEVIAVWLSLPKDPLGPIRTEAMAKRYGAFTLIIIGEGFISITRAFNLAISGFNITTDVTYPQVILAIMIMYLLFTFLFTRFDPSRKVDSCRALIWETIHFPMHFNLILLLAALVVSWISMGNLADTQNAIVALSFAQGISQVTDHYISTIEAIMNGTDISMKEQHFVARYFDQLYLQPGYNTEISLLRILSNTDIPIEDPTILAYQYLGQIMFQVTNNYGIELDDSMVENLQSLYALNTTWSTNDTIRGKMQSEAFTLLRKIIQEPASASLSGILWLFPTAGIALIFCAIRALLWHRNNTMGQSIIHITWIILGLVLACLGLLDIGSKNFDIFADTVRDELKGVNPMYWLVHDRIPLVIVMVFYIIAYLLSLIDKDGTTVAVKELPDTFEELSQASWSEIEDMFTNRPKAKAVRRLQKDLTKAWKSARKERKFELVKDLGISDDKGRIEEITLIFNLDPIFGRYATGAIEDDTPMDCLEIVYSRMLTMLDSGQVPTKEEAVFEFDPAKKKFVCDGANDTNSIGRQMIDHQHQWWEASGGIMSDLTERITEAVRRRRP
ncbi:hypothetical protein V865_004228 [Kwoniella europaea PYCC6329]|uniref:Low temperature requirement protein LtrA n=1 Tax=Kwoniella europaea PYCC6329 TaxID=1423913 RepID=A0AAX4KLE1_9TREE